jgi:hypothetical protein
MSRLSESVDELIHQQSRREDCDERHVVGRADRLAFAELPHE